MLIEVLARSIRKEKREIQTGKDEAQVSLFAENVMYIKNLKTQPENSYS